MREKILGAIKRLLASRDKRIGLQLTFKEVVNSDSLMTLVVLDREEVITIHPPDKAILDRAIITGRWDSNIDRLILIKRVSGNPQYQEQFISCLENCLEQIEVL